MQNRIVQHRIVQWGNSLALRIPAKMAKALGLSLDSKVELSIMGDRLLVSPVRGVTLEELVKRVTPENRHGEINWGADRGHEAF